MIRGPLHQRRGYLGFEKSCFKSAVRTQKRTRVAQELNPRWFRLRLESLR
jgi:hypothetical protein